MSDKRYMDAVASLGCIVCRNSGKGATPAEIHHIREGQGMSQRAKNTLVIPLCPDHHRTGGNGVALHGGIKTFQSLYGGELDLLAQTISEIFNRVATKN